jgi:RNase H-fold protein (predicted Holliday junction resolvase)
VWGVGCRVSDTDSGPTPDAPHPMRILAIDPGRIKCGLAVLDAGAGLLERGVVPRAELVAILREWCARYQPEIVLLGSGTGAADLPELLTDLPVRVRRVPERDTTRLARARYFADHPPRGWRRLLPTTLQTPPVPVDDYAAWLIAEQFLRCPSID